jgi:DUF2905 family protein
MSNRQAVGVIDGKPSIIVLFSCHCAEEVWRDRENDRARDWKSSKTSHPGRGSGPFGKSGCGASPILICNSSAWWSPAGCQMPNLQTGPAMSISRLLIIFGLVLVAAGLLWPLVAKLGLGRLPGDIVIERENFRLYLPIGTSVLISAILSLILWLLSR